MKFNPLRLVIDNPVISLIIAVGGGGAVYLASPPATQQICKADGGTVTQSWRDRLPSSTITYNFKNAGYNQTISRPTTERETFRMEAESFCGSGRLPGPRINVSLPDFLNALRH